MKSSKWYTPFTESEWDKVSAKWEGDDAADLFSWERHIEREILAHIEVTPMHRKLRNWNGDLEHENGEYENTCISCGNSFIGHKRRTSCRLCVIPLAHAQEVCKTAGFAVVPVDKLNDMKWDCDKIRFQTHHCDFRVRVEAISQQLKALLGTTEPTLDSRVADIISDLEDLPRHIDHSELDAIIDKYKKSVR